jgi:hypothetical protein
MAERLGAVRVQTEALTTLAILPDIPHEEAISVLTQAIELAESAGLLDQAARAHNNLGVTLIDPEAAREHFLRAAELQRQRGEIASEVFSACNAANESLWLGDLAAVEKILPSLWQLLDAVEEPGRIAMNLREVEAALQRFQGELAEALEGWRVFRREARAVGYLQAVGGANLRMAFACLWEEVGQEEEVEAILQELLDLGERGMGTAIPARTLLSVQRARQGEIGAARHLLDNAREQAALLGQLVPWEPYLVWAEAHLALAGGHWPEALAAFKAGVDVLGRRKLRWHRARTLLDWAEAHAARGKRGDHSRARELLREAQAAFEEMGAPRYVAVAAQRLEALEADS